MLALFATTLTWTAAAVVVVVVYVAPRSVFSATMTTSYVATPPDDGSAGKSRTNKNGYWFNLFSTRRVHTRSRREFLGREMSRVSYEKAKTAEPFDRCTLLPETWNHRQVPRTNVRADTRRRRRTRVLKIFKTFATFCDNILPIIFPAKRLCGEYARAG